MNYKSLGFQIGTSAINLPSSFQEILFVVRVDNNDAINYSFNATREYLARNNSSVKRFRNGYYASATSYGGAFVNASPSSIAIQEVWNTSSNVTSTSNLWVWYR